MKIELKEITVRDLVQGYADHAEGGVVGFGGALDIRPPYQREFIYKDAQRDAVIHTITKNYPLNVLYWAVRPDGGYEVIDGQQRSISICQFVEGDFSVNLRNYHNLPTYFFTLQTDEQTQFLDYKLMVDLCSGTDSEKLEWFRTINIAGEKLTEQELRNAVYSGSWVTEAKRYFSKNNCPAYHIGGDYLTGTAIRQDYLETVISWINDGQIDAYMAQQQHRPNANDLRLYFESVISWVKATFPKYRREMKGVDWGSLYNTHKGDPLGPTSLETEITALMQDDDVGAKKGIYPYVLTRKERHLNIRTFSESQRRGAYERQNGICAICGQSFAIEQMEADHITPWHAGGKTQTDNCQMLCKDDNRRKSGK